MTKEQYYEKIKEIRSILANPDNLKCSCPNTKCEWHGDCKKCVAQHRYFKKHIPSCLQSVFNDKMKDIVQIFEMTATENERIPSEYWDYVRERDRKRNKTSF
ncbi:MAG: hypothetical protein ABSD73_10040 [Candidatus Bathyarchaeia archaeon]|jgi:hypothetical protein